MLKLTQIFQELNHILTEQIDYAASNAIWYLDDQFHMYDAMYLGEFREVIEDRLQQAHSMCVRAGY